MRIFALETNSDVFKKKFLYEGEQEILTIYNHGFRFFTATLSIVFITLLLVAAGVGLVYGGVDGLIVFIGISIIWLLFVFPRLLSAYIDWRYDFTFVTTDKVVLVDQSSLFRQRITPINLENFASVSTVTQFFNLFPFGKLHFHLKSGVGKDLILPYIGHADEVAARIANVVTEFQRRKDLRRFEQELHGPQDMPA